SPDSELVPHSDGTTTFDGLFVVASSSDITLAGKVLDLCCGERITTTATTPLLQFDQSNLTVSGSFLRVADGGQLTSTSTDPLVPLIRLTGGIHDIGTAVGPNTGALMDLRGVNQDASGLGTDQVLKVGGPVFQANGATVNVGGSGNAVRVDTALLAASAPIVKLISSTMDVRSGDTTLGAMSLVQSKVTSNGPVFGLNNSILTVQNGPLLSLSGGTQMTVTGNLLDLSGGSQIKVFNGPLIFVDGGAATTKSTLNISGGLVNFGGTGNQVIINNNTSPTATFTRNGVSIPVSMTSGATVNMGPNVIGNPAGNTFSVTGTAPSFIPTVGVAIQGVNGARIGINAAP
ncbi:MAG TPA: hypothetical protein VLH58_04780, partial [Candidatus Methylomirabilis sp.]|nr:hypothetical protein [Candidatus Methylomirabilis sp.]